MNFILIIILILILIPISLFIIFVKKFNGIKEVSIIIFSIVLIFIGFNYILKKSDTDIIKEKLYEAKLSNVNDYKILTSNNEENWDYYYEYELKISNEDKTKLINEISKSNKFKKIQEIEFDDYRKNEYSKELNNDQIIQNYNIKNIYIRRITFPNSSREFEIEIDSETNKLKILDHYL